MPYNMFTVFVLPGLIISIIVIVMSIYLFSGSPQSQARMYKKMGMAGQFKRGIKVQLILALEDPEIRAMLYDAMQEESRRRKQS